MCEIKTKKVTSNGDRANGRTKEHGAMSSSFLMKKFFIFIGMMALKIFRWTLDTFPRFLLDLWYRNDRRKIPPITDPLLLESVSSLAAFIRQGKLKSADLVKAYMNRIREVQPLLNTVIDDRFEGALAEAYEVDRLIANGKLGSEEEIARNKPLLGVPFTAKDSFAIKGMLQTVGLVSRKNNRANEDAEPVILLREAGAIPLALTNVPELILWYDSNNNLHGRTNNPYNLNRIPGGSSGGEGSLISAAGSLFGLGSDVGGSIRIPAFYCGVYGHKPSPRIVPNEGQHPPIESDSLKDMLVIGPICRYAEDLKPTLKVLAGKKAGQLKLDEKVDLSKLRIYYMEDDGGFPLATPVHPDVKIGLRKVLRFFEETYGIHPQKVDLPQMKHSFQIWGCKMCMDSGDQTLAQEMSNRNGEASPVWELAKKLLGRSQHTIPVIVGAILDKITKKQKNTNLCIHLLRLCADLREEFLQLLQDDGVFVFPGNPEPAIYHQETLLKCFVVGYTGIFNALGLPVTQVPTGLSCEGLPVGVQVVAGPYQDRLTIAVAEELEKRLGGWISPCDKTARRWKPEATIMNGSGH